MITESQVYEAVGEFLEAAAPGLDTNQGEDNRVPEPEADNYVLMHITNRIRLSTNKVEYSDPFPAAGARTIVQPTRIVINLDLHGPAAGENAQRITTLFNDAWGPQWFREHYPEVSPLHLTDAHQLRFINGQEQYELRYQMEAHIQVNPAVSTPQDFADSIAPTLIEVDAEFPPNGA